MRNILLASLLVLTSCVSARVESTTLIPAVVGAWPAVKSDVQAATTPPVAAIELMDVAVEQASKALLRQVPWELLRISAEEGIQNQLTSGMVGPNGASLLREQLIQMDRGMLQLQKPIVMSSPQVRNLPTMSERVSERRLTLAYSNPHRCVQ
jgi:hypothetical protein